MDCPNASTLFSLMICRMHRFFRCLPECIAFNDVLPAFFAALSKGGIGVHLTTYGLRLLHLHISPDRPSRLPKSDWLRTGSASWSGAQGEHGPFHGARDHARQPWAGRSFLRTCGWCLELWNLALLFLHVLHAICRWWEHSAWYLQYCLVPAWRAPWVRRVWRRWLGSYYSGVAVPASRRPPHLCWLAVWQLLSRNWLAQTLVQTAPRTIGPLKMKKGFSSWFQIQRPLTYCQNSGFIDIFFWRFEQVLRRTWSASWWASAMPLGDAKQSSHAFTPRISRHPRVLLTLSTPILSLHQENGRLRSAAKAVQAKIGKIQSFWIYWPILTCNNSWRQGSWSWKRVSRCRISLEARGPRNWCRREET